MEYVLGIVLILASVFLIVAVLLQSSKSRKLSGTIAGGAETFFGKTKGSSLDKKLSTLTTVVAIVFVVVVLVVYLVQPGTVASGDQSGTSTSDTVNTSDTVDTSDTADTADTSDVTEGDDTSAEADDTSAEAEENGGEEA